MGRVTCVTPLIKIAYVVLKARTNRIGIVRRGRRLAPACLALCQDAHFARLVVDLVLSNGYRPSYFSQWRNVLGQRVRRSERSS